jgi:hypothetical protein
MFSAAVTKTACCSRVWASNVRDEALKKSKAGRGMIVRYQDIWEQPYPGKTPSMDIAPGQGWIFLQIV